MGCVLLALLGSATAATAASLSKRSANSTGPLLTIHEDATKILMISAREHRVYSRWDKTHHRALSPYGRAMADAVRAHLRKSQQKARVLMLGLGGGVIAGDLLCNQASLPAGIGRITAVEAYASVAKLAETRFFGAMFAGPCASMRDRLRVVVGDAMTGGLQAFEGRSFFSSVLVDVPAAYESAEGAPTAFYAGLLALCAPGGLLVLNTLYEKQMEVQAVQAKLHDAGWRNISAQLVETAGNRLAKWRPRANVIVVAVRE